MEMVRLYVTSGPQGNQLYVTDTQNGILSIGNGIIEDNKEIRMALAKNKSIKGLKDEDISMYLPVEDLIEPSSMVQPQLTNPALTMMYNPHPRPERDPVVIFSKEMPRAKYEEEILQPFLAEAERYNSKVKFIETKATRNEAELGDEPSLQARILSLMDQ